MRTACTLSLLGLIALTSCSKSSHGPLIKDRVPLTKVTGKVLVDGEPAPGLLIKYVPKGAIAETRQEVLGRLYVMTDKQGIFSFRTYTNGDGVPPGEYKLLMSWVSQDKDEIMRHGEVDKLGGQYLTKPYKEIKVEGAQPMDLGTIELASRTPQKK